jgi:NAD(P)H-hydrate epimerase
MLHPAALLTAEQSRKADQDTIASGTSAEILMEKAGKAVADVICEHFKPCRVLIVCGNGNNGGDGRVVERLLRNRGWRIEATDIESFTPSMLRDMALVVDAIFGTGLNREITGPIKDVITAINESRLPAVAIDIASGINANNGAIMGAAIQAVHTVTFVRPKPGHLLLPGKAHTGELHIYDIGISGDNVTPNHFLNVPAVWKKSFPFPALEANKYTRGHALIVGGGPSTTGAARLAARGALRNGAGLVSVACTQDALPIYAATLTSVMTKPIKKLIDLDMLLEDKRITAALIGPGCGVSTSTREQTLQILSYKKACVIDADAISAFKASSKSLFSAIQGPTVLTPHEGEFARIFDSEGPRPERLHKAAKQSNAVIVLKGNDTAIVAPDGRMVINANAPPWLATAGSGDVLAGMITGLLAQNMPAFEAACAAVWLHGEAANQFGPGLIAEDLPEALPAVLKKFYYG